MDSPVQQIKERLSIEEVVGSYVKLERAGINLKARCPFHNEKTPSFFVSPGRGSYYCFGCGASGDIFTFVEEFEGLDFRGTLKLLAERAGVNLPEYSSRESKEKASEKERAQLAMEAAAKFFEANLAKQPKAIEYLKSRGLTEESIKSFRLGYASDAWQDLYDHLLALGFKVEEMERAGLIKMSDKALEEKKERFYDRFRSRIMFPISDSSGRVIAFSGRIFPNDEKMAKYLNSPETILFNKSAVLYGIDRAKDSIRKNNFSILVEGQMDLLLSHQVGYRNTVASSGTALSDKDVSQDNIVSNLGLVRRLSNNIVLAFDPDKAGVRATDRAGKIALSFGMDVKVAALPKGLDPADLISSEGVEGWRRAIKDSKHLVEFTLDQVLAESKDEHKAARNIKEKVLPLIASIDSEIEKTHFLKIISDKTGIPEKALSEDLKKISPDVVSEGIDVDNEYREVGRLFRKDQIKNKLLGIVFWQREVKEPILDPERIFKEVGRIYGKAPDTIEKEVEEKKEDLIFEAEVFYQGESDLEKDAAELLKNLEQETLKEELESKMRELRLSEEKKDFKRSAELLKICKEINDKIQNIKNEKEK
jgi:DNA primase